MAPPTPPSFLQYLLLSRGLLILLSVPVASLVTHVITANHQRSLAAGGRLKEEGDATAAAMSATAGGEQQQQGNSSSASSRGGEMQLQARRPLSTFGIPLGFLDPCFALASRCSARAADLVTSATVVKVVCLPLCCFYFFRVLMSRVGLKVRAPPLMVFITHISLGWSPWFSCMLTWRFVQPWLVTSLVTPWQRHVSTLHPTLV